MAGPYDTIVIGAGIEGSATAYHLAKDNKNTLLLEQFLLPHTRGSSHGASRLITRKQYGTWVNESLILWQTLENEAGIELYRQTGILVAATAEREDYVGNVQHALENMGAVFQRLSGNQINKQFPMLRFKPSDVGIYDKEGGVLLAEKCLQSFHKMFIQCGGNLKDGEPVTKIIPGNIVTVVTSKATYQARSIVIAAGPWTSKIVTPLGLNLPLRVKRTKVCYWRQKTNNSPGISYGIEDNYPCVILEGFSVGPGRKLHLYSTPTLEYPMHVKICPQSLYTIDPDARDMDENNDDEKPVSEFIKQYYPGLEAKCNIRERCITTDTPDFEFILDRHPHFKNIIIGAGFSGYGFKMAPVVGKKLSQLASYPQMQDDSLSKCSIRRFSDIFIKSKM